MDKYLIEIELSGVVEVKANSEQNAVEIANNLGIDEIEDYLLNYKVTFIDKISS